MDFCWKYKSLPKIIYVNNKTRNNLNASEIQENPLYLDVDQVKQEKSLITGKCCEKNKCQKTHELILQDYMMNRGLTILDSQGEQLENK